MFVKRCRFESDVKKTLNLDNDFMTVDLNDQFFKGFEKDVNAMKSSVSLWKIIVSVSVPAVAISVFVAVIVIKKKRNQKEEHENETGIHSNLMIDFCASTFCPKKFNLVRDHRIYRQL